VDQYWFDRTAILSILLEKLGLVGDPEFEKQLDKAMWVDLKERLATLFLSPRPKNGAPFYRTDICFAPVLSLTEAPLHPHNRAGERLLTWTASRQPVRHRGFQRRLRRGQMTWADAE
jgi:alpha-methylacyl-CoA racemase